MKKIPNWLYKLVGRIKCLFGRHDFITRFSWFSIKLPFEERKYVDFPDRTFCVFCNKDKNNDKDN